MEKELVADLLEKEKYDFEDLRLVMKLLRSENGCPWDKEQDHHSIRSNLIEETYEVDGARLRRSDGNPDHAQGTSPGVQQGYAGGQGERI